MTTCGSVISNSSLITGPKGRHWTELQENLKDLYQELTSGNIPEVRRVAELQVS